MPDKRTTGGVVRWLLAGDPAIRWQTLRDLAAAPPHAVARERGRVGTRGWGRRLLARQDDRGTWAGGPSPASGLYTPKWTSTTYTLLVLRDFGLDPGNEQARTGCRLLLDGGQQPDGGVNFGDGARRSRRGEACVSGMVLSLASYFQIADARVGGLVRYLLEQQMEDGGWNCRRPAGATHSSMNSTISVLEGLRAYEIIGGRQTDAVRRAQRRGRDFLLAHRLFRSHRTGTIIKSIFLKFAFPPRWHYDVLRALDHFRAVGAPRDPRLSEAIDLVRRRRRPDGRWPLDYRHHGETFFELERVGAPSRWNTLRALRVLRWWEGANP